jgi:parallel beta-helix repeat protein
MFVTATMNVKKIILLTLALVCSQCFALSIKTVMNDGQGDFDPWNKTRWAAWYDSTGKLQKVFTIDCSITFASGHNTLATAWCPEISSSHSDYKRLFYFDESCYGVVVNGNGTYIDTRPAAYRPGGIYDNETITDLYNSPSTSRVGPFSGFCSDQAYNAAYSPVQISNIKMYGFSKGIATWWDQTQRIVFNNCGFFRGNFIGYIHCGNITFNNCEMKENYTGIYLDKECQNCIFTNNVFRDNAYQQEHRRLYGDIQMDSASRNTIEGNVFEATQATEGPYYRCGIKFYRNKGESDEVRQHPAGFNIIRNNSFTGYTIGCDVASRQGDNAHDLAAEARDFAYYNRFENNTFSNCLFGIKINNSGNTIRGNTFTNVDYPILLHDIFYSLTENTITCQPGTPVYFWHMNSEWYNYDFGDFYGWQMFERQAYVNESILESQKYIHIRTDGTPNIESYTGPAKIVIADTQLVGAESRAHDITGDQSVNMLDFMKFAQNWLQIDCNFANNCDGMVNFVDYSFLAEGWKKSNNMKDVYAPAGKTPLDIAVGDFWVENPGDEISVVWNEPMSNISGTNYYTVNIYDSNGIENNRCGRGSVKYTSIVAGNFFDTISSYFDEDGSTSTITCLGNEIAAISSEPNANGCYPIYILSYSRKKPIATLLAANTTPIKAIAAGNFVIGDTLDELAVIFSNGTSIQIYEPQGTYVSQITVASNIKDFVGGDFDTAYAGDEIASIDTSFSLIYFYRTSKTNNYYKTAGNSGGTVWTNIGAGNFYLGSYTRDEIAVSSPVASNGIYKIFCYELSGTTPIKTIDQDVLGVSSRALDGGTFPIPKTLGLYERAQGFYSADYTTAMSTWAENIAVLPSAPQTTATPVFWLNSAPADSTKQYLKVTPIVR